MAKRECPKGAWKITFHVPVCAACTQFPSMSPHQKEVCLYLTNHEFVSMDSAYRRSLASMSKDAILHGNLEAATQRCIAELEDIHSPVIRYVINTFAPYAFAEKYSGNKVVTYAGLTKPLSLVAMLSANWHFNPMEFTLRGKCILTGGLMLPCLYYMMTHKTMKGVQFKWIQPFTTKGTLSHGNTLQSLMSCGNSNWKSWLSNKRTNMPEDPKDTVIPVVDPQPGEPVYGTLPDGTLTTVPQGAQIASSATHKVLYADTVGNVETARIERIEKKKKAKPFSETCTKADRRAIGVHISALIENVFTKDAVSRALEKFGMLELMKSKKWTYGRLEEAIIKANSMVTNKFPISVHVKNEGMNPEKPPRMIIADGDIGQICALAVTTVFEEIMFTRFERRCIKHASKQEAMDRILKELAMFGKKPHSYVENDGSAWDTTCRHEIMTTIEKPIFERIWHHMLSCGWVDTGLELIHSRVNYDPKFRAVKRTKKALGGESFGILFECMQRSGRRPTSSSNFLINMVMDLAAYNPCPPIGGSPLIGKRGEDFLYTFTDRWGNKNRKLVLAKEGDDTGNSICPPLTPEEEEDVRSFWDRCGFNMKMFVRTKVFEFAGWKVPIVNGCIEPDWAVPDFLRNIDAAAITTSSIAGVDSSSVAASKFRSYSLALHKLPTVAQMFKRWSDELAPDVVMSDEDMRRLGVDDLNKLNVEAPDFVREKAILESLGILRDITYNDFCVELENQQRNQEITWFRKLSYFE